jgi:predicted O-methyltransferase YrrM
MLACDATGAPIPWYTYPAIDFLAQRNFEEKNILEFGGGQSTLWWSSRAGSVLTIEEDATWCDQLSARVGKNVTLHYIPVDHATRTIEPIRSVLNASAIQRFDIIIVDGHLRQELAALAFSYLAEGGALILDDAEGYGFYEELKGRDCQRIDFFGFVPGVSLRHCTSIVFVGCCFMLKSDIPIPVVELAKA